MGLPEQYAKHAQARRVQGAWTPVDPLAPMGSLLQGRGGRRECTSVPAPTLLRLDLHNSSSAYLALRVFPDNALPPLGQESF